MLCLPLALVERIFHLPFMRRPRLLAHEVSETPLLKELRSHLLAVEIRGRHLKWVHLLCPKCGEQVELPLAGNERWKIKVDLLRRPTLVPSIWENASCGAHFTVRKGEVKWCR